MAKFEQEDVDWLVEHSRPPGGHDDPQAAKSWYEIDAKSKGKRHATVWIMDEIDPWFGTGSAQFAREVGNLDVDTIDVHINSPGGLFAEGVAIMNVLRGHKATVSARIEGLAASAATIVAMGADTIEMAKGSQMMIHEGSGLVYGPMADMLKMAAVLEKTNALMAQLYAEKAGGTAESWREAMNSETWYTDQEAVDAGLADTLDTSAKESEVVAARTKWNLSVFAHAGRDKAPAPYTPTDSEPPVNHEEDEEMPNKYLVETATRLGVKDADKFDDDEKLSKAIEALNVKPVDDGGKPDDTDGGDDKPTQQNVRLPDGMVLLDADTITALQKDATDARAVVKEVNAQKRDAAIEAAITDGKIPAARKGHWQTFWDNDKDGAKAALDALPKNLVPLAPIGRGDDDGQGGSGDPDYDALYPNEVNSNG